MPPLSLPFTISPRSLAKPFDAACARLDSAQFASSLWSRRLDVWTSDPAVRQLIANRLGWLTALDFVAPLVPRMRAFADSVTQNGFTDVVLLGMGGSSLAPEVLRQVLCSPARNPRFRVLDSVDPDAVRAAMARAKNTLFVLASKSGSTIEPNVMAEEAKRRVIGEGHGDWAKRFIAITDQDTALHRRAVSEGFRDIFVNPSDIGGRYSALSLFGMVPAALMGLDLDGLLTRARVMEQACRVDRASENPGVGAQKAPGLHRLEVEDVPHASLEMPDLVSIGAEFLRWEVATATAGLLLDINPFDEPNVQQAKDATRGLLDRYQQQHQLPFPEAHGSSSGARLTLTEPAVEALGGSSADAFLQVAKAGDYVALLAYLPSDDPQWENALQTFRQAIATRSAKATSVGFGPRYLHSTGQLHKGGAPNGVFIIITADATEDLAIPEAPYSFGVLETAQALGDFQSLDRTGRRGLLVRLSKRDVDQFEGVAKQLVEAL